MAIPESLAGVGLTAVGVALIRARESTRSDRLFNDPYAQLFADAAEADFLGPAAPSDAAESWARMQELVEAFAGRVLVTKYFDDYLLDAVAAGCTQIVILGAGLDTRALRLPFSGAVTAFELDMPPMFEFKERILDGHTGSVERVVVPTDLRQDWYADLTDAGFRADLPTAWLEEGVLAYLPDKEAGQVLSTVTSVAMPESRLAKCVIEPPDPDQPEYRKMRAFVRASDVPSAGESGADRDNAYRLAETGWRLEFREHNDLAESYGRPGANQRGASYLTAIRQ